MTDDEQNGDFKLVMAKVKFNAGRAVDGLSG